MSLLVIDASIAAAWLFDDEEDRRADAALATLDAALAWAAAAEGVPPVEPAARP